MVAPGEGERLQKVLAAAGVASRRAAEDLISQGRVSVDGRIVTRLGTRVDPTAARIEVDGERISVDPTYEYIVLNKPAGIVTTARDPQGRRTVVDLVSSTSRVYPVGRLDADTQGLILLTNHGDVAHRLMHPRFGVERVYLAEVRGEVPDGLPAELESGVRLADGPARAKSARIVDRAKKRSVVELTMTEGRKHEVRRMFDALGFPVEQLSRVRFGPISLRGLRVGESRALTPPEIGELLGTIEL